MNIRDIHDRSVRLTDERLQHIESDHPEMVNQLERVMATLSQPEKIVRSRTDPDVQLFYRFYDTTPVTKKFLCVVVKVLPDDNFIITAFFTDAIKRGELLWEKK